METERKTIVAALDDLMFGVRISEAARRAGLDVKFARHHAALLEQAVGQPALIILDLNCAAVKPLESITALKSHPELKQAPLLAYVSHVQTGLKQQALELGCDRVLARSVFVESLAAILEEAAR